MTVGGQNESAGARQALAPAVLGELYRKSRAAEYGISSSGFAAILADLAHRWAGELGTEEFLESLRLEDLALARGCAAGNEHAWEVFMLRFREKLYDFSRQITRQDSSARELADSVYAELFGTRSRDGARISKLASYGGRGSLDGWLRTVLAQEYVNGYRKQRRLVSLDEESEAGGQFPAPRAEASTPADPLLERATEETLRSLAEEERFLLASYFLDQRTLAQVARVLGVHESTISRKVEKLTKSIRKRIVKSLVSYGMSRRQAEEALSADVRDFSLDIRASLTQAPVAGAFPEKEGGV
ncbi:MAG: sigma-70 family RNA polymerase sigma factor [Acidobacteria bacterium]|nr:sigma-70 family RNA polymerase sigma factor [Acidobacteriota bacterium]